MMKRILSKTYQPETKAWRDLVVIGLLAALVLELAIAFDAFGRFIAWYHRHGELEELEEMLVVLFVLGIAFAIFAWRRWMELRKEITRRRWAEEAVQQAHQEFCALSENLPDIILRFDRQMRHLYINHQVEAITGLPVSAFLGKTNRELGMPEALVRHWEEEQNQVFETGQATTIEFSFPLVESMNHFESRIIPEFGPDGSVETILCITRDITERKRAEKALTLFRSLIDHTNDAIEVIDPETGRFLDVNEQACLVHGYTREEYLALTVPEIDPSMAARLWEETIEKVRRSGSLVSENQHRRKDGSVFPVEVNATYIHLDRDYLLALVRDITERKQLEKRLETIYQLGQELTLLQNETAIVQQVLKTVADVLHFEMVGCGLVDEAADELEYCCYLIDGILENIPLRLPLAGPEARSIGAAVVRDGQPVNISDIAQDSRYGPFLTGWAGRSALCVPIKRDQRVIGVLNVESLEPTYFTLADQQLLQTLADQTAVALENAHLYNAVRQRVDELAALNIIGQAIASSLDLQETLTVITNYTTQLLNAAAASVVLRQNGELWFAAASGEGANFVRNKRLAPDQGVVGWVMQSGQPVLIPDTQQDSRFFRGFDQKSGFTTHSLLCVPLEAKEQIIGAIEVMNKLTGSFSQEDLRLLCSLAPPAATAIENAWLFEAEQRQHEIATILAEVVASVSLNLSTDELLHQILLKLRQLLAYDSASIFLIKGDQLVIEAAQGFEAELVTEQHAISQNVLFQEMLNQKSYILIQDTSADIRYQPWRGAEKVKAWVGAPLVVAQEIIGYLTVDRYLPGAFTVKDADLIQAFAHQVAQTIYNARLFADLMATRAQLIERERLVALGQMAATVAHELRNPLMAIRAGVEYLLYDVPEDDPRWEGAALMRANIKRIDRIVENILFISRAPQPNLAPGLLQPLIENEIARWNLTLAEKEISCHLQLADDLPPMLLDSDQMGRALTNLIGNSVDVLPRGGALYLTLKLENQNQVITLLDNGPGISPEQLPKIFEPFFTTKSRGTGLGLSIVKQIVNYHQGDITVWSELNVGTQFTISLPHPVKS